MNSAVLPSLLIAGASCRAAASLARAGNVAEHIATCDLFADGDLQQIAEASRIEPTDYPFGILEWSHRQPPGTFLFTGGLENFPDLIQAIAARHQLAGTSPQAIRQVRDPFELKHTLEANGWQMPPTIPVTKWNSLSHVDQAKTWLLKPMHSSAGLGIHVIRSPTSGTSLSFAYLQRFISGRSYAGIFVADESSCRLITITQSWTRGDLEESEINCDLQAGAFVYSGSMGRVTLPPAEFEKWSQLGRLLHESFELRGLFCVDTIVTAEGRPLVLEVNPRFSASMETIALSKGNLVDVHLAACQGRGIHHWELDRRVLAKAVLYAPLPFLYSSVLERKLSQLTASNDSRLADLPRVGQRFDTGQPVLTILAAGRTPDRVARIIGLPDDQGQIPTKGLRQDAIRLIKRYGRG